MQVFRGDEKDIIRLVDTLAQTGVTAQIERYGPTVVYAAVKSSRPDIAALASMAGRSIRRVHALEELQPEVRPEPRPGLRQGLQSSGGSLGTGQTAVRA